MRGAQGSNRLSCKDRERKRTEPGETGIILCIQNSLPIGVLFEHMDASPLFDPEYLPIIAGTLIGFGVLAALLLVPIWRFLNREEEVAEDWTPEAVAERMREREQTATNGAEPSRSQNSPPQEDESEASPPSPAS